MYLISRYISVTGTTAEVCDKLADILQADKYVVQAAKPYTDGLAREHYAALNRTASDCNNCGECEPRCPFHVKVRDRMREIAEYMGK